MSLAKMEIKMELMEARMREMQREYETRFKELEARLLKTTAIYEEKIQESKPSSVKSTILKKEDEPSECKMTKNVPATCLKTS